MYCCPDKWTLAWLLCFTSILATNQSRKTHTHVHTWFSARCVLVLPSHPQQLHVLSHLASCRHTEKDYHISVLTICLLIFHLSCTVKCTGSHPQRPIPAFTLRGGRKHAFFLSFYFCFSLALYYFVCGNFCFSEAEEASNMLNCSDNTPLASCPG